MISKRDVISIRVPFPNELSGLAKSAYMYICMGIEGNTVHFVKCQTNKFSVQKELKHFCVEDPDLSRNPFARQTLIDCDKEFVSYNLAYGDALKTNNRPDVCAELMEKIEEELSCDGYETKDIDEKAMLKLNKLVSCLTESQ